MKVRERSVNRALVSGVGGLWVGVSGGRCVVLLSGVVRLGAVRRFASGVRHGFGASGREAGRPGSPVCRVLRVLPVSVHELVL